MTGKKIPHNTPEINKEHAVCFSGYRMHKFSDADCLSVIRARLENAIEQCICTGYRTFLIGMADGFDMMAAESIVMLKDTYSDICFVAVIPWNNWRSLTPYEQKIFERADNIILASQYDGKKAYRARNRYLVDNASLLICYYSGTPGGTQYTLNYAHSKKLHIINIYNNI